MAHKSHRHKALQAQLEPQPEISIVTPKISKAKSKVQPPNHVPVSTQSMDVDQNDIEDDDILISTDPSASASTSTSLTTAQQSDPSTSSSGFAPLPSSAQNGVLKNEFRRVPIPPHRMTPLKREWVNLYTPMVEMLGLQVRMNVKRRCVEMKVCYRFLCYLSIFRSGDCLASRVE